MLTRKIFQLLAIAGYPVLLHLAVVSKSTLAVTLLLCAALLLYLAAFLRRAHKRQAVAVVFVLGTVILLLLFREHTTRYFLFSIPVLIYLGLFFVFGRTLIGGREPLIAQISRRERGGILPPELVPYTRGVTLLWTGYFAGAAVLSLILARYTALATWSTFANIVSYLILALLFFGEYFYRRIRFPEFPHSAPTKVVYRLLCDGLPNSAARNTE